MRTTTTGVMLVAGAFAAIVLAKAPAKAADDWNA